MIVDLTDRTETQLAISEIKQYARERGVIIDDARAEQILRRIAERFERLVEELESDE